MFENSVAPIAVYKMFKILTSKKKNQTKHEKENSFFNPDGNLWEIHVNDPRKCKI